MGLLAVATGWRNDRRGVRRRYVGYDKFTHYHHHHHPSTFPGRSPDMPGLAVKRGVKGQRFTLLADSTTGIHPATQLVSLLDQARKTMRGALYGVNAHCSYSTGQAGP